MSTRAMLAADVTLHRIALGGYLSTTSLTKDKGTIPLIHRHAHSWKCISASTTRLCVFATASSSIEELAVHDQPMRRDCQDLVACLLPVVRFELVIVPQEVQPELSLTTMRIATLKTARIASQKKTSGTISPRTRRDARKSPPQYTRKPAETVRWRSSTCRSTRS